MDKYKKLEYKDKFLAFLYSVYNKTYISENLIPFEILLDDAKQEYIYNAIFRKIADMHKSLLDNILKETIEKESTAIFGEEFAKDENIIIED